MSDNHVLRIAQEDMQYPDGRIIAPGAIVVHNDEQIPVTFRSGLGWRGPIVGHAVNLRREGVDVVMDFTPVKDFDYVEDKYTPMFYLNELETTQIDPDILVVNRGRLREIMLVENSMKKGGV